MALTGKTRVEVSALRHLRETYDALARTNNRSGSTDPTKPETETTAAARDQPPVSGGRGRVLDTVHALQQPVVASPTRLRRDVFDLWLTLETLATAVDVDVIALRREIDACDARTSVKTQLPADGFDTLDAKLLVLSDVLGRDAFASYTRDLFGELAALRTRCALYGDELPQFQEQIQLRCIGAHCMRGVLSHTEWLEVANASLTALRLVPSTTTTPTTTTTTTGDALLLVSHFPVLMQHCSPPRATREGESPHAVDVLELLRLLERLPPARERLVALCFEQISDVRRGAGIAPPPEGIRPHKLAALAKQNHANALCSRDELDRIMTWLDEGGVYDDARGSVSATAFLRFHTYVSDTYAHEDAEFVAFLMRVWSFVLPQDLAVGDVVADYEARCQESANRTRKAELLQKLDHVRAALPTKLTSLRHDVGQLDRVTIASADQFQRLGAQLQLSSGTLRGLRVLCLRGLSLREFPTFVVVLPVLEELDLGENQLRDPLPLAAIGSMKTLLRLVLCDNRLCDRSFSIRGAENAEPTVWHGLAALTVLDLSRNQLTTIPEVVLQLRGLTQLTLAANQLQEAGLSTEVASHWATQGFPQLQTLDVRENQLTTLPDALFTTGQRSLMHLYAQTNQLTDVPASIARLEALHEASFSHNRLRQLGTSDLTPLLARCHHLSELALDHNQLKVFPLVPCTPLSSSLVIIHGIRAIRLPHNRLRVLPSLETLSLVACQELDLRNNALRELSDAFFAAFPHLRTCHLQQNALTTLPPSIASCSQLHVLECYENKLTAVPASLATLKELTVLNLRDNQLTTVPSEWHAFAQYMTTPQQLPFSQQHGRTRVLQTLYLQRNPLRNKVLQTLVDGVLGRGGGGSGGGGVASSSNASAAPFKSSATLVCEMYVRKLIDTLKQSVAVETLARAVHAEARDDRDDDGDGDDVHNDSSRSTRPPRRWKGRARFVIQHIEAQLKAKSEAKDHEQNSAAKARLLLAPTAFQKLLSRLLVASTKKELRLTSERFQVRDTGLVDGLAFLCGVEAVGLFNTLPSVESESEIGGLSSVPARRCESVRKPVDAVASILQYLHVADEQKLRAPASTTIESQQEKKSTQALRSRSAAATKTTSPTRRPRSAKTHREPVATTRREPSRHDSERHSGTSLAASAAAAAHHQRATGEVERQRARIHVLEQQLLDQRLLRMTEQNTERGAVEPSVPPTDHVAARSNATTTATTASPSVLVHVKLLNRDAVSVAMLPEPPDRVVIATLKDATVTQLKQTIAHRLGVDVARQVLLARDASSTASGDHVRLRDDVPLASYFPSPLGRWHVSLLVSDRLRVDWSKVTTARRATTTTHQGTSVKTSSELGDKAVSSSEPVTPHDSPMSDIVETAIDSTLPSSIFSCFSTSEVTDRDPM